MFKLVSILIFLVIIISFLNVTIENSKTNLIQASSIQEANKDPGLDEPLKKPTQVSTSNYQTQTTINLVTQISTTTGVTTMNAHQDSGITMTTSNSDETTTQDPETGEDSVGAGGLQTTEPSLNPAQTTSLPTNNTNKIVNPTKPTTGEITPINQNDNTKLSVLFYSIFIVYVSFIKLVYHNVDLIKGNLTEPGILMIFGIIWELVARQINTTYDVSPKFNSRIFFYLFLPSTVLEAAALLSNKWLLLNLLPIIVHSILGTLLYASGLGFTIYSLSQQNVFNLSPLLQTQRTFSTEAISLPGLAMNEFNITPSQELAEQQQLQIENNQNIGYLDAGTPGSASGLSQMNPETISNLTLADCLMFGTILSSVDSTTMLATFRQLQMNDKLYFLVLGENLLNNAVVLIVFDLLLDFLSESRLTVVKIYFAIIQFFITLVGSILVGLLLALFALISIRLTKRFQGASNSTTTSYQSQTQTMVETLLILKLAYLTYSLAGLTGTSSIVSLATFGILQDQYIKHNLNLRSQLTLKQVVLATRTLGSSLVYPLLGMLLVEVSNSTAFIKAWLWFGQPPPLGMEPPSGSQSLQRNLVRLNGAIPSGNMYNAAASIASSKLSHLADQASLYWNFKFLSLLTLLTLVYRFLIVILLSFLCNLFTSNQLRIKLKEQILLAYGSFKGPLAFAMVSKLIEHEEYRDRTLRNKHLFMYTILSITFASTIIKGGFIRPLVSKIQLFLVQQPSISNQPKPNSSIVFNEINSKITECLASGLNSILGHTRSPYDKFADLNELTIKPWLSRTGSNTNWLSVFYDNLILDETLNANCFYRSTGEQSYLAKISILDPTSIQDSLSIETRRLAESSSKFLMKRGKQQIVSAKDFLLNTIHEDKTLSIRERLPRVPYDLTLRTEALAGSESGRRNHLQQENSAMLKEFVMFNLKLDEARRRKRGRVEPTQSTTINESEPLSTNRKQSDGYTNWPTRMLSTTSSGDIEAAFGGLERIPSTDEELNKQHKERYLREMEARLVDTSGRAKRKPRESKRSRSQLVSRIQQRHNINNKHGLRQSTSHKRLD